MQERGAEIIFLLLLRLLLVFIPNRFIPKLYFADTQKCVRMHVCELQIFLQCTYMHVSVVPKKKNKKKTEKQQNK